jgi:hypothetical protein
MPPPPAPPVSYLAILKDEIDAVRALSFAEQSALLLKLKQALSNPKTADVATDLLRRFRGRDDLLARVAAEIDTALASVGASLRTQTSHVKVAPIVQPAAATELSSKTWTGLSGLVGVSHYRVELKVCADSTGLFPGACTTLWSCSQPKAARADLSLEAGLAVLSAAARTTLAERANQLLFKL